MLKDFITKLECSGFNVEDEGEIFGLYFVILKEEVIELNKKFFPMYKAEKESSDSSKTILDFEIIIKEFISEHYITNRGDL